MKNRANALASQIMGSNCYIIIVYLVSIIFLVILTYSIYFRRESTTTSGCEDSQTLLESLDRPSFLLEHRRNRPNSRSATRQRVVKYSANT